MADHLTAFERRMLTNSNLLHAYRDLTAMLNRYRAPATFGFVMAFLLDQAERKEFDHLLRPTREDDHWMRHVVREQAANAEGWHQPGALDAIRQSDIHEVACHGFCHRSLADGELSAELAKAELDAAQAVAIRKQIDLQTMIFPRNRIGNLAELEQRGFLGYRTRKPARRWLTGPLGDLIEELSPFTPAEPKIGAAQGELVAIPHGHFFNWRHGKRRLIPPAVTVHRWKAMIERAAASDGVAHLWLHPHNFITGPGTWQPFERVIAHASAMRDAGRLEIITQADYCAALQRG